MSKKPPSVKETPLPDNGPNWIRGSLFGNVKNLTEQQRKIQEEINAAIERKLSAASEDELPVMQQSDLFKPFLLDIGNYGLLYAYHKYYPQPSPTIPNIEVFKEKKTDHPLEVVIIGAGMSGLVAAYELAQSGHKVKILEMQHRVGGRLKTIGEPYFYTGLWSDSGGMRLPGEGLDPPEGNEKPSHFMTDFYAQKFKLPVIPFVNSTDGYYKFYGQETIRMSDWDQDKKGYCDRFWPGWSDNVDVSLQSGDDFDIGALYNATVVPVMEQLKNFLIENPLTAWERWIDLWSRFSLKGFFRSTYAEMILKLQRSPYYKPEFEEDLRAIEPYLPWTQEGVVCYSTFTYILDPNMSLVDWLRDELGQWWKDPMHTYRDGLSMLPNAFVKKNKTGWNKKVELNEDISFGRVAYKIRYGSSNVFVHCRNETTMREEVVKGDKVIITLPINIIRGLTFEPALPQRYYQALETISIEPSTKVMIQTRTRFWQTDGIQGGFSKTNLPIGQIHYPSNPGFEVPTNERGILMCYTWKKEALIFGSQTEQNAIAEVVEELSQIHPEVAEQFEVGAIQSWYDDPSAQGAFVLQNPEEYDDIKFLMKRHQSIYFCGEALSFANGWIQGALESGMRSAYQLFADNESQYD